MPLAIMIKIKHEGDTKVKDKESEEIWCEAL